MQINTVSNQVKHQKSVSALRQSITQEQAILESEQFSSEVCMLCVGEHMGQMWSVQGSKMPCTYCIIWILDIITKVPIIVLMHCSFLHLSVLKILEALTYWKIGFFRNLL